MPGLRLLSPLAVAGCMVLASCVGLEAPTTGEDQLEIVGGTPHTGDPAVVLLDLGGGICTGTLVSPRVVLTAAHCLQGSASEMSAHFIDQIGESGLSIAAERHQAHPTADIGAVLLSDFADGVTPIPPNSQPLDGAVGQEVRIVGFGVTGENSQDSGLKRLGYASLSSVSPNPPAMNTGEMATSNDPQGTCYGDSGGPNFMTFGGVEYVAGVTSRGTDICGDGVDIAVRVDSHYDWLASFIETNDPALCGADGRCAAGCATLDTDCCVADGACVEECGSMDPECGGDGTGEPGGPGGGTGQVGPAPLTGGCSAGGGGAGPLALLWILGLVCAAGLWRRRAPGR